MKAILSLEQRRSYVRSSDAAEQMKVTKPSVTNANRLLKEGGFLTAAKRMIATDYSGGMIREAKKGAIPANLTFEAADATALPYADDSFDVVLIANALHVMPEPEKALREIDRVLRQAAS